MINNKNNFPLSRYMHCHNVGLKMYHYAKEKLGWTEGKCQEMFVLGTMHDIGYELSPDADKHNIVLGNILKRDGYKYANEIKYHSYMQEEYDTPEMRLLYFGDMTIDGYGKECTLNQRLEDIKIRHGENSDVYEESLIIANKLIEWGFDDSFILSITKEDTPDIQKDLN